MPIAVLPLEEVPIPIPLEVIAVISEVSILLLVFFK